jgi:hypothetical protein
LTASANTGLSMSGVNPSPSDTGASPASSGMKGAYRHWSHRGAKGVPATTGAYRAYNGWAHWGQSEARITGTAVSHAEQDSDQEGDVMARTKGKG